MENTVTYPSLTRGTDVKIGRYTIIEGDIQVGDRTVIKHFVELREDTIIGADCYIDSGVKSSGDVALGNRVTVRYNSILARGVRIMDDCFIAPQLMTENINHRGESVGGAHIGVGDWDHKTKYRVFIGTNVTLAAGILVFSGTIIGSKANVRKSITEPGVYIGNPARRVR